MVAIIFEAHATTSDNEMQVPSGHFDAELSGRGFEEALKMHERYAGRIFDAVFCSDLQRAFKTAEIGFSDRFNVVRDARLRECDYGEYTRLPEVWKDERERRIDVPFPGGESYKQVVVRVQDFLTELSRDYDGKRVLIVGHRATYYALEHLINGLPLEQLVSAAWQWQPGWIYRLNS